MANADEKDVEAIQTFRSCLQQVIPSADIKKTGSRSKGTSVKGSDYDYFITYYGMTGNQAVDILECCLSKGLDISLKKAFTVHSTIGPDIDFFPANAAWHNKVGITEPGARNALRYLKMKYFDLPLHDLERLVLDIRKEKGWTDAEDSSGEKTFQEANLRLLRAIARFLIEDGRGYERK